MNCCDDFGKCRGGNGCPVGDADSIAALSVPVDVYGRPTATKPDPWFEFGDKLVLWASAGIFAALVAMSVFERFIMWGAL